MSSQLPNTAQEFLATALRFADTLSQIKRTTAVADYGWYPYDSLSVLSLLTELLAEPYEEVLRNYQNAPIADLGCADGDLAMVLASFGISVDAIDHKETNFNQMRGVCQLNQLLGFKVSIFDLDLDAEFGLPRSDYGLILLLGTLYHLRNPIYVLSKLAAASDWCILSTRIARVTPLGARMEAEPLAYLLDSRETNNDPTNYWIFSPKGLTRVLERSGWTVIAQKRVGCDINSDPVSPANDERVFVLVRSRIRNPDFYVQPAEGWYEVIDNRWRWTAKYFSILVALPSDRRLSEFALRFEVPDVVIADAGRVKLSCQVQDQLVGSITCDSPESIEFRGIFPPSAVPGTLLTLDFFVDSSFTPENDGRSLGVIIPLLNPESRGTARIPFRVS